MKLLQKNEFQVSIVFSLNLKVFHNRKHITRFKRVGMYHWQLIIIFSIVIILDIFYLSVK